MLDSLERVLCWTFWAILLTLRAGWTTVFKSHVGFTFPALPKIAPHSKDSATLGGERDVCEALLQDTLLVDGSCGFSGICLWAASGWCGIILQRTKGI